MENGSCSVVDLLVDRWILSIHQHGVILCIDFGVEVEISNQIDDPVFCMILVHLEFGSDMGNVDRSVYSAGCFKNKESSLFLKLIAIVMKEIITGKDLVTEEKLLLCHIEIEVDEESLEKLSDGILVSVLLLLDDFDDVTNVVSTAFVDDNSCGDVSENMRAGRLNGVEVTVVEEQPIDDLVAAIRVVKPHKQTPVDQP